MYNAILFSANLVIATKHSETLISFSVLYGNTFYFTYYSCIYHKYLSMVGVGGGGRSKSVCVYMYYICIIYIYIFVCFFKFLSHTCM